MWHELPLVIFTIAAQMSVGSFVVLGLIHLLNWNTPQATLDKVTMPALYAIGPLLVLGLAASTLHLGSPLRAANALLHLQSSWLSREILLGMFFAGSGALFAVLQWFRLGSHRLRQALALVTAIIGLSLVYAISQVYSLRTIPAWSTFNTPLRFYITTFLLGGVAVAAALVVASFIRRRRGGPVDLEARALITRTIQAISFGSIFMLGLKFIAQPAYMAYLGTEGSAAAQATLEMLSGEYMVLSAAQNILIFLGVAGLGFLLFRMAGSQGGWSKLLPITTVAAFVLILSGEFIGRLLFYATMVRVGI
ncbi:MAG: dimethyl sulfoxide reductase anchor subunit [Propionibacteriaceae bacterium]|nr:dimethyl sulfoxide reductase anchor subunit [Propionibacteriaceae bacterium]